MKYKLININTKEEHLCDKVTIEGFDYYALKTDISINDYITDGYKVIKWVDNQSLLGRGKVIATNNSNIDIPKVVDEVEELADNYVKGQPIRNRSIANDGWNATGFVNGYNKSQETHPFSEEDMIEFSEWLDRNTYVFDGSPTLSKNGKSIGIAKDKLYCRVDYTLSDNNCGYTTKELLQLWKEQQPKIVYYE